MPYMFGILKGVKLSASARNRVDRIARKHDASLEGGNIPGTGLQYWFSGPNQGEPFDSRMARDVLQAVADAGITHWGARPGRPATERGRGSPQVVVRLAPREHAQIEQDAKEQELTSAELLRRSYFGR